MLHFLYSLFFRLALPVVLLRLWWQGRHSPQTLRNWQQRLGFVARSDEPVIWVHAVSVGETIAAAPLVRALLRQHPGIPILLTAMTATGAERARALFGDQVRYAWAPFDLPGAVRRFMARVQPRALVIMETELWPNMICASRRRGVPVFLINARLSERSMKGYQRIGSLVQPLLGSISWIAAQAEDDACRFLQIGAHPDSVSVTRSIKFDVAISPELRQGASELRAEFGRRPVWIAASTHDGEDAHILAAHRQVLARVPECLLVIVPRHPERFNDVSGAIALAGLSQARRSLGQSPAAVQVYVGDTMGELLLLYGASDMAFVGGSLIERGGHNPLEPAAWAIPVLSGPHYFNFATIYQQLAAGRALFVVHDEDDLARTVTGLVTDPERARSFGANARAVVDANRGALEQVVEGISRRI